MTDHVPPHNEEVEASVLGALLLTGSTKALEALVIEDGLRPEHFYRLRHQSVFKAMLALHEREQSIDPLMVAQELTRGGKDAEEVARYVHSLPTVVPAVGAFRDYGQRVVELARLRSKLEAFRAGVEAVYAEDWAEIASAEGALSVEAGATTMALTPEAWAMEVSEMLEGNSMPADFQWPFRELNIATEGGARRKQTTILSAWTNTGKSILADQIMDSFVGSGDHRGMLYINEMGREERGMRYVSRHSGVRMGKLLNKDLDTRDWSHVLSALGTFRFGITEIAGWTADEVAFDIRRNRWDCWCVDLLSRLDGLREERDWAHASAVLNDAAKRTDSHGLIVTQLNEGRASSENLPRPTLRDIRGSGSIKNDADNVLFLYRNFEDGEQMMEGSAFFAKVRTGSMGHVDVRLLAKNLQFVPLDLQRAA